MHLLISIASEWTSRTSDSDNAVETPIVDDWCHLWTRRKIPATYSQQWQSLPRIIALRAVHLPFLNHHRQLVWKE